MLDFSSEALSLGDVNEDIAGESGWLQLDVPCWQPRLEARDDPRCWTAETGEGDLDDGMLLGVGDLSGEHSSTSALIEFGNPIQERVASVSNMVIFQNVENETFNLKFTNSW